MTNPVVFFATGDNTRNAQDAAGTFALSATGSPGYADGVFVGVQANQINAAQFLSFNPTGRLHAAQGSIAAWVRWGSGGAAADRYVFSHFLAGGNGNRLQVYRRSSGKLACSLGGNAPAITDAGSAIADDTWALVGMDWVGAAVTLRKNGAAAGTATAGNGAVAAIGTIAYWGGQGAANYLQGRVGPMLISSRSLTNAEWSNLAARTTPWHFDLLADLSGTVAGVGAASVERVILPSQVLAGAFVGSGDAAASRLIVPHALVGSADGPGEATADRLRFRRAAPILVTAERAAPTLVTAERAASVSLTTTVRS